MNELRKEGYSNKQIADQLDVSYQTVLRGIGPQNFRAAPEYKPEPKPAEPDKPRCSLKLQRRTVVLAGTILEFHMDTNDDNVTIKSRTPDLIFEAIVPKAALPFIANDISEAAKY